MLRSQGLFPDRQTLLRESKRLTVLALFVVERCQLKQTIGLDQRLAVTGVRAMASDFSSKGWACL